jgi:hypothetical protein
MLEEIIKLERNMKLEFGKLLNKKTDHKCLYPNCNNDAILSHSISKSTLKNISKDNYVIFQKFNRAEFTLHDFLEPSKINMKLKDINISSASTFKGFCRKHDNDIFESIDNKGIITLRDIYLQLYRTSAKQYFLNNMTRKAELKIFQKEYYTNEEFEQKKTINLENIVLFLNDLLTDFPELEQQFSLQNNEVLWLKPFSKNVPLRDIQIMFKKLSVKYPIALESSYTLVINQEYHSNITILLPTEKETLLFVLCHKDDITQYTPHFQSELKILNFIESLIMTDSEFYLDPIEYEIWNQEKIKNIEQDLYFLNERKFLQEYDISIFDNIRKQILKSQSHEIQEHENNKINNKPKRLDLKTRFWNLGQFIELGRRKMQNTTKQSSE